ncbi:uracil-DNA glycosylase family protein [Xenophilus aerolatus]|nr:uracil-DNA glycosylase family protein [Xenophilus aerolatus]
MTLVLDARQRAMLEEMGVKVWLPTARHAPVPVPEAPPPDDAPAPVAAPEVRPVAPAPAPAPAPVVASPRPAPTAPAVPATATAAASGASDLRIATPQALYAGDGRGATGGWLVVADMPPGADGRHGAPLAGDAGRLLDQMLRALQLHTGTAPVHLVRAHRAVAGAPAAEDDADFDAAFDAWAAPLAPRIVLAMGPLSAQRLLGRQEPLGRLRGQACPLPALGPATHVVATYHPAYLLRNGADKARAWADLCLAAAHFDGNAG